MPKQRFMIQIPPQTLAKLRDEASQRGISTGELIRRAIDAYIEQRGRYEALAAVIANGQITADEAKDYAEQ